MRKLLNTLYITTPDIYLTLKGDTIIVTKEEEQLARVPLLNLEAICTFGYAGASPALMHACASKNIALTFLDRRGRFLARVVGESYGNVVLRKTQYRISDSQTDRLHYAKHFIFGKIANQKWMLERATRENPMRIDVPVFKETSARLSSMLKDVLACNDEESLRGIEGQAALLYFQLFNQLILQQKDDFVYKMRSRRPPLDRVNALLSFTYTLLMKDTAAALENVGLDSYVGFLHTDRPGRQSLALDVMEELRSVVADRFVLKLINKKMVSAQDFIEKENGAVLLTDDARKKFLKYWQERKQETLTHPFLGEKINWGLVPHAQALLLARTIRQDVEQYPPFIWK